MRMRLAKTQMRIDVDSAHASGLLRKSEETRIRNIVPSTENNRENVVCDNSLDNCLNTLVCLFESGSDFHISKIEYRKLGWLFALRDGKRRKFIESLSNFIWALLRANAAAIPTHALVFGNADNTYLNPC